MHKAKTNNNFTKFISMLLVVLMLVSIVPITASADRQAQALKMCPVKAKI